MKRLSGNEKGAVVLGLVFVVAGVCMIARPTERVVSHPGPYKHVGLLGPNQPEYVSKRGSQIYGVIAVLMGAGIVWLGFYPGHK